MTLATESSSLYGREASNSFGFWARETSLRLSVGITGRLINMVCGIHDRDGLARQPDTGRLTSETERNTDHSKESVKR